MMLTRICLEQVKQAVLPLIWAGNLRKGKHGNWTSWTGLVSIMSQLLLFINFSQVCPLKPGPEAEHIIHQADVQLQWHCCQPLQDYPKR